MNGILIGQSSGSGLTPDDNGNINAENPILISNGISSSSTNILNGKNNILLGEGLLSNNENNCLILGNYNSSSSATKNCVIVVGNGTSARKTNALTIDKNGNIVCNTINGTPSGSLATSINSAKNAFKTETFSFNIDSNEPKFVSNFTIDAEWYNYDHSYDNFQFNYSDGTIDNDFQIYIENYGYLNEIGAASNFYPDSDIVFTGNCICTDGSNYRYNSAEWDKEALIRSSTIATINNLIKNMDRSTNEIKSIYEEKKTTPVYLLDYNYISFDTELGDGHPQSIQKIGDLPYTISVSWEPDPTHDPSNLGGPFEGMYGFMYLGISFEVSKLKNKIFYVNTNNSEIRLTIPQAISLLFDKINNK